MRTQQRTAPSWHAAQISVPDVRNADLRRLHQGEGKAGRMGARLMAIVAEGDRGRIYLAPTAEHGSDRAEGEADVEAGGRDLWHYIVPRRQRPMA